MQLTLPYHLFPSAENQKFRSQCASTVNGQAKPRERTAQSLHTVKRWPDHRGRESESKQPKGNSCSPERRSGVRVAHPELYRDAGAPCIPQRLLASGSPRRAKLRQGRITSSPLSPPLPGCHVSFSLPLPPCVPTRPVTFLATVRTIFPMPERFYVDSTRKPVRSSVTPDVSRFRRAIKRSK